MSKSQQNKLAREKKRIERQAKYGSRAAKNDYAKQLRVLEEKIARVSK